MCRQSALQNTWLPSAGAHRVVVRTRWVCAMAAAKLSVTFVTGNKYKLKEVSAMLGDDVQLSNVKLDCTLLARRERERGAHGG